MRIPELVKELKGINGHEGDSVCPSHIQQTIYVLNKKGKRKRIVCDAGIVPLIRELWANGYETLFSCEGDDFEYPYVVIMNVGSDSAKVHSLLKKFWQCPIFTHDGNSFYALKTAGNRHRFENLHNRTSMDKFI